MIPTLRQAFNEQYTEDKYRAFMDRLNEGWPQPCAFRVAETPVFLDAAFSAKLVAAGEEILQTVLHPGFKELTERAIPQQWQVPGDEGHPHFLAFDFGVTKDADGALSPRLIEIQGFPSLFGFQVFVADTFRKSYDLSPELGVFYSGLNKDTYLELLRRTIVGPYKPEEVVLMDINAPEQKTAIDFFITQQYLGIPIVSLSDLVQEERKVFYRSGDRLMPVKRIYNRLIFDELESAPEALQGTLDVRQDLDVEWITHPAWFYRISKFTMPFLKGDFIPKTCFLNELDSVPQDLERYVLKPLFSFAGQGVIIDVTPEDIAAVKDPENWILQEKITYEPVVQTPEGGVKCEIRLLYLWPDGDERPTLATNLVRLSRGKMIGVRYNKDFNWVGGTTAFMAGS